MKKSIIFGALAAAGMIAAPSANAALSGGEILDFDDGVWGCAVGGTYPTCDYGVTDVVAGSFFAMDTNGSGVFDQGERVAMVNAGVGITLGSAQAVGAIDNAWAFAGSTGWHYTGTTNGVPSVNTDGSVDMTGWTVFWGATPGDINMGTGAAATVACTSGTMTCAVGESFTLDYLAVVPSGDFTDVAYQLHLEGVVGAVPVPAAVWLFGSGLLGLVGVARRRKAA